MVPRMMRGAYAAYNLELRRPVKMQARQCIGSRLMMKV